MTKTAAALLATCLIAFAGCASGPPAGSNTVVRAVPPRNHETTITNYFDATARSIDPSRELVIGTTQPT